MYDFSDNSFASLYAQSIDALKQKRLARSIQLANELYQQAPRWGGSHRLVGLLSLYQKKYSQAESALLQALALDPQDDEALFYLLQLPVEHQRRVNWCLDFIYEVKPSSKLYLIALAILNQSLERHEVLLVAQKLWHLFSEPIWALQWAKELENSSLEQAFEWCLFLKTQVPQNRLLLEHLARLSFEIGDVTRAESTWRELLQLAPSARFLYNLGQLYVSQGQISQALPYFRQALECEPDLQIVQAQLAHLLIAQYEYSQALPYLEACLKMMPQASKMIYQTATKLMNQHQAKLASGYFRACLAFPSQMPVTHDILSAQFASCLQASGESDLARENFLKASQLCEVPLLYAWPRMNALPFIYEDLEHIQTTRQRFALELNQWEQELDTALAQKKDLVSLMSSAKPPFLLSYHGLNNKELMWQMGQCWHRILEHAGCLFQTAYEPRLAQKIRIGFVSSFFYHHSVMIAYSKRISDIANDPEFEVVCIHLGNPVDAQTESLKQQVQQFVHLKGIIELQPILDLKLDILIYLDIGMDAKTYQLAFHRLAPIQCVLLGHPDTTGIPNIDYYLSNHYFETTESRLHYTETLLMANFSFSNNYHLDLSNHKSLTKSEIGFHSSGASYFCPMVLFKVHPDFMQAVADILRQDLKGRVYFVLDQTGFLAQKIQAVFQSKYPDICSRIEFLPWMQSSHFYCAIQSADAVLDTFHFGGGTTLRICMDLDRPVISWSGEFARGRMARGLYLPMNLEHLISVSQSAYVQDALKMAHDRDFRQEQHVLIAERKHIHFQEDQSKALEFFKQLFRDMINAYPDKLSLCS